MTEPQPEYVWVFPEKKNNRRRIWLIVGLSVLAVAIAVTVALLVLRPWAGAPAAAPSPTPSASISPTATPTPTLTLTPSPTPSVTATSEPTTAPSAEPTSPPAADPDLATFRSRTTPVLDAAATGLRYAREDGGMSAMQDIMLLQDDAARLNEMAAPASIASRWADALAAYSRTLEPLRAAYERGADVTAQDAAAASALSDLNEVIGR